MEKVEVKSSFIRLEGVHDSLNELFLRHQEALLSGRIGEARALLESYITELKSHMEVEEGILMPVYERAGRIEGGPPEFFTGEHRRMLEHLDRFSSALEELGPAPGPRAIIALLDGEASYKSLCEHHEQREKSIFFPALDRVTEEDERRELIGRCLAANARLAVARDGGK